MPTLLITVFLWIFLGGVVYFIDPNTFGAIQLFFVLIFLSILFTFSLLFANSRRGIIGAVGTMFFLVLLYLGVGNILNLILIIAIAICVELYFGSK